MYHPIDYPPFPPKEPSPEMKALYEKVRDRLDLSRLAIITAKEGGGTREFVAGVDDVISIHVTEPRDDKVILVTRRGKHRS